ncbi:unnamed protein product [Polarella glacialis]|uniref:Uncharacterized protein n=1 Tax=Polarella glacialis TaxID=89957 RepID=A0A813DHZ5_POLGL|nr:unnamed protein product [Polarella glacialis]CAE8629287.1 unnamed protein product [Polarella glacialis]
MALNHAGMIPNLRPPAKGRSQRARELDFVSSSQMVPLPEYKPMFDVHLQHLWVNPRIKKTMQTAGFLDDGGKPVDVDAHRRKLYVIEQELSQADATERHRAMDKEIKRQGQLTMAKRRDAKVSHLHQVSSLRDSRRARREAASLGSRSAGSLPAIAGSPQSGDRMAATFG